MAVVRQLRRKEVYDWAGDHHLGGTGDPLLPPCVKAARFGWGGVESGRVSSSVASSGVPSRSVSSRVESSGGVSGRHVECCVEYWRVE